MRPVSVHARWREAEQRGPRKFKLDPAVEQLVEDFRQRHMIEDATFEDTIRFLISRGMHLQQFGQAKTNRKFRKV